MTLTPEKFKQYFKLHKLAQAATVEAYMAEHPQEEYHYEDIDAVYQRQVEINVSRRRHLHAVGHQVRPPLPVKE